MLRNTSIKLGTLFVLLAMHSIQLFAMSFNDCSKVSQMLNKNTPMQVDQHTVLKTTYCSDTSPKPTLNYLNISEYDYIDMTGTKGIQRNSLCTNPNQKKLLEAVDVKYTYSKKNGAFLGSTFIKLADCY